MPTWRQILRQIIEAIKKTKKNVYTDNWLQPERVSSTFQVLGEGENRPERLKKPFRSSPFTFRIVGVVKQ